MVGLCENCRNRRVVPNTRGSTFWLCELSRTDPSYPRYPRLPVLECPGHEPEELSSEAPRSRRPS